MKENVDGVAIAQATGNSTLSANARLGGIDVVVDPDAEQIGNLVRDTVAVLPVKPVNVSRIQRPRVRVQLTEDPQAVDVRVEHGFRAHFGGVDGTDHSTGDDSMVRGRIVGWSAKGDGPSSVEEEGTLVFCPEVQGRKRSEEKDALKIQEIPFNRTLNSLPRDLDQLGDGGSNTYHAFLESGLDTLAAQWQVNPDEVLIGPRLAVGGFAEVYLGKYRSTLVAVKVLFDDVSKKSFAHEILTLVSLRHPNLILMMGYSVHPKLTLISEYMQKGSLFNYIRRMGGPLNTEFIYVVALSVSRGMSYCHSQAPYPILHLDLKSPNILIDGQWRIKIADFGLSRLQYKSVVSHSSGTPEWMAPEILCGEAPDKSADVFSFGVILWECLTGKKPWEDLNPMQVVGVVGFRNKCLPLPDIGDPFLIDLCRQCMAIDPKERPTFADIVNRIESKYLSSQPIMKHTLSQHALADGKANSGQSSQLLLKACPDVDGDKTNVVDAGKASRHVQYDSLTSLSPFAN